MITLNTITITIVGTCPQRPVVNFLRDRAQGTTRIHETGGMHAC
jgi:hypothetical protein